MTVLKKHDAWFGNVPVNAYAEIVNGTGSSAISSSANMIDIITAGGDGLLIDQLILTSNDSSARVVGLYRKSGGNYYFLGAVSVAANSGTNGTTAAVDALSGSIITGLPINNQGKRYIRLDAGDALAFKVTTDVTNTAGMAIRAAVSGVEFEAEA